jgi:drug/metabolite transporter (DMT)-like permease
LKNENALSRLAGRPPGDPPKGLLQTRVNLGSNRAGGESTMTGSTPVRHHLAAYLSVVTAACCWATSGIFIKLIMSHSETSAIALAFWRDLATFLAMLAPAVFLRGHASRLRREDWSWVAALGISLGLFHAGLNFAVFLNGAAVTAIQQTAMPAIVIVVERIVWRETLTRRKIAAIILIAAGTIQMSGLTADGKADVSTAGILAGFSVPALYAAWSLLGKRMRRDYDPLPILTHAFGVAALVLLPFQFHSAHPWPVAGSIWMWFAGLVALSTVSPFLIYTFGLGKLPAGVVTIIAMSEIVFSSMLAYLFLNETLALREILGAGVIAAGIVSLFLPCSRTPTNRS